MMTPQRPFLLDVTRLISRSWTGRQSTGIDRVCYAYLRHFGPQSHAVVQHRGIFRVLDPEETDKLYDLLLASDDDFRKKIAVFSLRVLTKSASKIAGDGAFYINVSHTDFDLPSHAEWIAECDLRPIYLLHDLIPILHSEYCSNHAEKRHRGRVTSALKFAAGIVVNSNATAGDLIDYAHGEGIPMPPVLPVHLARSDLSALSATSASTSDASNSTKALPYFLCVGTIERRKNHQLLFEVWLQLLAGMGRDTPQLVIVGQPNHDTSSVMRFLKDHPQLFDVVTVKASCAEAELKALIEGARAMLLPSLAEGFGIPMIESLGLGTPVIASDLRSFREIGQGVPTLLDPTDVYVWAKMIRSFTNGGSERQRQMEMMPDYRPTTWRDHFALVDEWLCGLTADRDLARDAGPKLRAASQ